MKKVARFEAKDGKEFKNKNDCAQHEKILLFHDWYVNHELNHVVGLEWVDSDRMIDWLQKYRLQVLELLGGKSNGKT